MAGNVYTPEVAGSLEIAVLRLGRPFILVLGHTDCTAVSMAHTRERVEGGAHDVTRRIGFAIGHLPREAPVLQAIEANVARAILELRERSRPLREREEQGRLRMAGAVVDLESGRVRLL
jgi:carbonic anhydrase